ncbi:hypothetical protein M5362_32840 [Streptomyces sp. Je 1-79]|uniref:hypothetical protein n=1 Tax=Streptomyces sp. Je 1-79 TaxID=2943847 RepID=UPI0021A7959D|nr:hypothetical protein [Streptomyces sp. Je 1-79]MCT4357887.1 hypothetical protein [Streptomyces sp. Je 1-79]
MKFSTRSKIGLGFQVYNSMSCPLEHDKRPAPESQARGSPVSSNGVESVAAGGGAV